jgi:uncharacterized protein (TIGR02231 family)
VLPLLSLAVALAQTTAPPPQPSGVIESVVVFPDRAAVTRSLEVELVAGLNEVRFQDLPPTLDEHTLQAKGSGVEGTRLLGLDVATRELAEDRRARVAELEDQIREARDAIEVERDGLAAATAELEFLGELKAAAAKQLSAELLFARETVDDASAIAKLLRTRIPEVQEIRRAANIALRDLGAKVDALERELATVRGAAQWSRRDVVVLVEAPGPGVGEVDLTYVLIGASWKPAYDIRASAEDGTVALSMNALVQQTTGEQWSDASLTLSTARPAVGIAPPELPPFWLQSDYQVYGVDEWEGDYEEVLEEAPRRSRDERAAPAQVAAPMEVVRAAVSERAVATTFEVPGAASIPGDGTRRKLRVTDLELETTTLRVVVPRVDPSVFLVAEATWEEGWPLLAGQASMFLDDAFVGVMSLPTVGTGEEVALAFGRDDAVRTEVEIVEDRRKAPDWMGRITAYKRWTFHLENGRDEAVEIEVRDRVPVPTESRYKVRYDGDEPDEARPDGLVTFRRALTAGAKADITFGYILRYPKRHPPAVLP